MFSLAVSFLPLYSGLLHSNFKMSLSSPASSLILSLPDESMSGAWINHLTQIEKHVHVRTDALVSHLVHHIRQCKAVVYCCHLSVLYVFFWAACAVACCFSPPLTVVASSVVLITNRYLHRRFRGPLHQEEPTSAARRKPFTSSPHGEHYPCHTPRPRSSAAATHSHMLVAHTAKLLRMNFNNQHITRSMCGIYGMASRIKCK